VPASTTLVTPALSELCFRKDIFLTL